MSISTSWGRFVIGPYRLLQVNSLANKAHISAPVFHARSRQCLGNFSSSASLNSSGLSHDVERSRFVAVWAYEQGEQSSAHTYLRKGDFPSLDGSWRDAMEGLRAVAETPSDYDC